MTETFVPGQFRNMQNLEWPRSIPLGHRIFNPVLDAAPIIFMEMYVSPQLLFLMHVLVIVIQRVSPSQTFGKSEVVPSIPV